MKRVLFVSEAVTLAQVVRLVQLARALPVHEYELHFASARFDDVVFADLYVHRHEIVSLSAAEVEKKVARGARIYGERTLRRYLKDDLRVIDEVKPDLIVGDLRWSLLAAAPARGIPLASLINAYWSPWRTQRAFPLPDHPIVRLLGERLAAEYFPKALPFVFRHFAAPVNAIRRDFGLPPFPGLQELIVAGDLTLYADVPELVPLEGAPPSHHFLGAVQWAPRVSPPEWWNALEERAGEKPLIYVTLGSSGQLRALPAILEALAELPVEVMLATAGRKLDRADRPLPANVHAAALLPGDEAARRARLVLCNGGSTTGYQALAEGRPVIGVPWNLDQYLAMSAIRDAGAGELLRASTLTPAVVRAAVERALAGEFDAGARRAQIALARHDAGAAFRALVEKTLGSRSGGGHSDTSRTSV